MNKYNLKYFLDLIDDDSVEVRSEILKQIKEYGLGLEKDILDHKDSITPSKYELILPFIEKNRKTWITENWNSWFNLDYDIDKIENALNILSKFHYGLNDIYDLSNLLDELAEEFMNRIPYGNEFDLSFFLFKEKKISGAKDDYYNPFNGNAVYTILNKKGLPITLSLIYAMVGARLGFDISGCNLPGHFMAKFDYEDELVLVDCFEGGKVLFEKDIEKLIIERQINTAKSIFENTPAELIIRRVLYNFINSYSLLNDTDNSKFFSELNDQIYL